MGKEFLEKAVVRICKGFSHIGIINKYKLLNKLE
jgi:hypothetical protein